MFTRLLEGPKRTLAMEGWQKPACFDTVQHHSPNQPLNHLHKVLDVSWAGPEWMGLWQTSFSWSVIALLNTPLRQLLADSWSQNSRGCTVLAAPNGDTPTQNEFWITQSVWYERSGPVEQTACCRIYSFRQCGFSYLQISSKPGLLPAQLQWVPQIIRGGGGIYSTHFQVLTVTCKLLDAENNKSKGINTFCSANDKIFLKQCYKSNQIKLDTMRFIKF